MFRVPLLIWDNEMKYPIGIHLFLKKKTRWNSSLSHLWDIYHCCIKSKVLVNKGNIIFLLMRALFYKEIWGTFI